MKLLNERKNVQQSEIAAVSFVRRIPPEPLAIYDRRGADYWTARAELSRLPQDSKAQLPLDP